MTNTGNALNLISFIFADIDPAGSMASRYNSCMDALCDMEYFNTIPKKYKDQQVVDDAWSICEARYKLLAVDGHYYDDVIPHHLAKVKDINEYFTELVLSEIEENIDKVFPDNYEYIESDAIESVIKDETLGNAWEICKDYIEYMREEYNQEMEVWSNNGDPIIVIYGKITERAHLDFDKIVEIAGTSGSDYFNIEFDWGC